MPLRIITVNLATLLLGALLITASVKVFNLQTLPAWDDSFGDEMGKVADFSLHAGVAAKAHERQKLERLCRYISRPAVSEKRLSLTSGGNVRYAVNGYTSVAGAGIYAQMSREAGWRKRPCTTSLTHLDTKNASRVASCSPPCRAPPPVDLFD